MLESGLHYRSWLLDADRTERNPHRGAHDHRFVTDIVAGAAAGYLLQMLGGERPQRLLPELEFSFHDPRP